MTDGHFKAFLAAIEVDPELRDKLRSASDVDNLVAIAKASGFIISVDELARAIGFAMLSPENFENYYADFAHIAFNFDLVELAE